MADEPEPEAPDIVVFFRWCWHQIVREASVIRRAPGATLLLAVVIIFGVRWFLESEHEDEVTGLRATIEADDAAIKYDDERLAALEGRPSEISGTGQSRMKMVAIARHDMNGVFAVNVASQNVGAAPAVGIVSSVSIGLTRKLLSDSDIDSGFEKVRGSLRTLETKHLTSETQPNDLWFVTFPSNIPSQQFDREVIHGTEIMYFFVRLEYRDDDVPPNKWRVTEACQ